MSSDDWGEYNEQRFLAALRKRTPKTPAWFRDMQLVTALLDAKGVDMRAKIKKRGHWKPMSVPIQIKSSEEGRKEYYRRHPGAKQAKVLVLVIPRDMSDDEIRALTYDALKPVLSYDRHHYKKYFDQLDTDSLSQKGRLNLKRIKAKRSAPKAPKKRKR